MKVYHGSPTKIQGDYIKPNKPFDLDSYEERVFVTEDYITALLYCVNPIKSYFKAKGIEADARTFSSYIEFDKKPIKIYELYEGFFEELFNTSAYIYISDVPNDRLTPTTSPISEYMVKGEVQIEEIIEIKNVWQELKNLLSNNELEVVFYKDWDYKKRYIYFEHYIETRAESCKSQEELQFFWNKFRIKGKVK